MCVDVVVRFRLQTIIKTIGFHHIRFLNKKCAFAFAGGGFMFASSCAWTGVCALRNGCFLVLRREKRFPSNVLSFSQPSPSQSPRR